MTAPRLTPEHLMVEVVVMQRGFALLAAATLVAGNSVGLRTADANDVTTMADKLLPWMEGR
jgi:hypothetical protein